jgi:poly(3-hydroxybutyrate) depolymerase
MDSRKMTIGVFAIKKMSMPMFSWLMVVALTPLMSWASNPSSGCSATNNLLNASGTYSFTFDGIERTFRLHVPGKYNGTTPAPMVTVFHGWGGDENEFLANSTVRREANKRGYILVAPKGLGSGAPDDSNNSWSFSGSTTGLDGDGGNGVSGAVCNYNMTATYTYPSCSGVAQNSCAWSQCQQDDVAFTVALVEYISSKMCIDTNNVFAAGGSNGGMFTWELGQNPQSAEKFRALASIIGLPHRGYLAAKGKPEDMPVLLITGTRDATVPPGEWDDPAFTTTTDGDWFYYTGATAITQSWAQAHGCSVAGDAVPFNDGYKKPDCRTYCSGDQGWPRVLDCRASMGHTYSFSWAWKLILDFFDQHSI